MISKTPAAIATAPISLELINVASVMSPRTTSPATIRMIPSRIRTQVVGADTLTDILDPFSGALMFRSTHGIAPSVQPTLPCPGRDDDRRDVRDLGATAWESSSPRWIAALKVRLRRGWSWNSGRVLRLGEVLLQPRDLFRGPVANIGHLDPRVDVVRRGVDMAVADRRCRRHEHVHRQLKKSYNRVPPQLRRHVRAAWRQHPLRFAIEAAVVEESDRVARILQVDDPHRSPCGIRT